jgi:transposase InsO family protein
MASSSSNVSATFVPPNITPLVSKLDGPNYITWTTQFLPALRTHDFLSIVDGSEPCPPQFILDAEGKPTSSINPEYSVWQKKDQFVLAWINATLTDKVLSTVYGLHTSRQVWAHLATRFAPNSKSHISHLRRQLQTMQQGDKGCSDYLLAAKNWADQLAATGNPVNDEELISYIVGGLNSSYQNFITTFNFVTREQSISFADFQAELLNFDHMLDIHQQSVPPAANQIAFFAQKPRAPHYSKKTKFSPQYRGPPRQHMPRQQFSNSASAVTPSKNMFGKPSSSHSSIFSTNRPPCQICGKTSHQALDCYHRMDFTFQGRHPPSQLAAMAAHTHVAIEEEQPWYLDSGANNHVTADIENLSLQQPYTGNDNVTVGNGNGLQISNTGSSFLITPHTKLSLNDILHCPNASSNLLSIQKFCKDNNCYFKLTSSHFVVKDMLTKAVLLQGPSRAGLYPIFLQQFRKNKASRQATIASSFTALLGVSAPLHIWHLRLGHPTSATIQHLLQHSLLQVSGSTKTHSLCEPCQVSKSKKLPFSASTRQSTSPLALIHSDVWTSPIVSVGGCKYYVLFVDDHSRFAWMYPLRQKSDVFLCFMKFKSLVENLFSCKIKQIQTDNGGEYISHTFTKFLETHGILHRLTCPYTSEQNGIAERKHRHIAETGLSLLAQSHLSNKYWVDAFLTAIYLINRMPTPVLHNNSPYFTLFQRHPDYTTLRSFGCACFPLLRPYNSHKLSFRSKKCIFLGYSTNQKGYRCLDPTSHRVYISRHVVFDETKFPAQDGVSASTPQAAALPVSSPSLPGISVPLVSSFDLNTPATDSVPNTSSLSLSTTENTSPLSFDNVSHSSPHISSTSNEVLPDSPLSQPHCDHAAPSTGSSLIPTPSPPTRMITRSQTNSLKPKQFADYKLFFSTKYPLTALSSVVLPPEPHTYKQAVGNPNWESAMQVEFEALIANKTWTLCPRPDHNRVVRNKWVYKLKQKSDGSIDRYKARLVAKGFDQVDGLDFTETFSPVIKPATVRLILAVAVHYNWPIHQLDVSNAFLHGHLEEEVFMEQPQGFEDPTHPEFVCKLHKSLYGLKQAPRAWFLRLSQALLDLGFVGSSVDTSLFFFHRKSVSIFLLVYVDDIIVTSNTPAAVGAIISQLKCEFALKDLGDLSFFLGIQANRDSHGLHLHQGKYITDLLIRVKMDGAKPASTPCVSGGKLSKFQGDPLSDPKEYRHIVGALQYCTLTRPDIAYSVNQLCQFLHSPTTVHLIAAKRVLRYLKGTLHYGLYYTPGSLKLNGFCDSDWAGCPDDRKSTTGYAIYLGPCLISWAAKKQPTVARSSTEAEYRSMALTVAELYWIRMLLKEVRLFLFSAPCLWVDNIGALSLSSNPVFHARTKHVEVDYHFIREKVFNKDLVAHYISTADQPSDIFTKGLTSARFLLLRDKLMVRSLPISLREDVNHTHSLTFTVADKEAIEDV